ncbi:hypothetical protein GJ496_002802 [Pomphorhynchus laevis]|nr:hypothetical protein GJ496_002802 [Pomphorhynchus laevis]
MQLSLGSGTVMKCVERSFLYKFSKLLRIFQINKLINGHHEENSIFWTVPKCRRSISKRRFRRLIDMPGSQFRRFSKPRNDLDVCLRCGHWYEKGRLCRVCYNIVKKETNRMQEALNTDDFRLNNLYKEVEFTYDNEQPKDKTKTEVKLEGKRPNWFTDRLRSKK